MKAQLSEIFLSVEGEGPLLGCPMLFIRTWSCNLTCPGFGGHTGKQQYESVASLNDVVPAATGCDSAYAWHPSFKNLRQPITVEDMVQQIIAALPGGKFFYPSGTPIVLCWTGGEPLMWQPFIQAVMTHPDMPPVDRVLFETNGTLLWSMDHNNWSGYPTVQLSISPKLTNSGETWERRYKYKALMSYVEHIPPNDIYLKFVSNGSEESFEEINRWLDQVKTDVHAQMDIAGIGEEHEMYDDFHTHMHDRRILPVYVMPEGVYKEQCREVQGKVVQMCMQHGYNFTPRAHLELFSELIGT